VSKTSFPTASRLSFARFSASDAQDFADLLSDPEVTRSIMAKATTPEDCLACAHQRIDWHNSSWKTHNYGVWALRDRDYDERRSGKLIGWSGLTATSHDETPEILYGLARSRWGTGLATEAAESTIDWTFSNRVCDAVNAIIFGHLNPGSAAVAKKLGMKLTHKMTFSDFLPDDALGRDVLQYEIWRLREGSCLKYRELLFQAPYKAGLIVSAGVADEHATLESLIAAALDRKDHDGLNEHHIRELVTQAYRSAVTEPELDVYHLSRQDWIKGHN
jgi:RimJ/RimL family protein N-acetyltransferase